MTYPALRLDAPARYRTRVQGYPVGNWFERMDDSTLVRTSRMGQVPVVALSGCVSDQGALIGVRSRAIDL
jgi:hypothetical protein